MRKWVQVAPMTDGKCCRRCGLDLFEEEKVCPNCGARVRSPSLLSWLIWFLVIYLIFLVLLKMGR